MKTYFVFAALVLGGCRAPVAIPPLPVPASVVSSQPRADATFTGQPVRTETRQAAETLSRKQAQWIEALINQNEALTAKLASVPTPVVQTAVEQPVLSPAPQTPPPAPKAPMRNEVTPVAETTLSPNAEGLIDLTAVTTGAVTDEPVNPFAVRASSAEKTREIQLIVGGTVLGVTPCAVINDRLVQVGEVIEGFTVERIAAGDVIARFGTHALRLPVSTQPVRVKLAL